MVSRRLRRRDARSPQQPGARRDLGKISRRVIAETREDYEGGGFFFWGASVFFLEFLGGKKYLMAARREECVLSTTGIRRWRRIHMTRDRRIG